MKQAPYDILRDSAVAAHASSARPAWLFSSDGTRLLFANAAGAGTFGIAACGDATRVDVPQELASRVARSAETLRVDGHPRLERLRGLGAAFGQPLTCTCARIDSKTGPAVLIAATEPIGPAPTLRERARYLLNGGGAAVAFGADGALVYATPDASPHISRSASLRDLGDGIETLRVGKDADALVLALFPANSQPITSKPNGPPAALPGLLDLSPIAEAITAMTKVPPHRNGQDAAPHEDMPANLSEAEIGQTSRRYPLRFFWETDAENRFTISTDTFLTLAGSRTRNLLGRFWGEISAKLALDPEGLVTNALVSRDTWSGIQVDWPTSENSITVTLSGIPVFDRDKVFRGYRGLGVWHGAAQTDDPEPPAQSIPSDMPQAESVIAAAPSMATEHDGLERPGEHDAADIDTCAIERNEDGAEESVAPAPPQTENVVPFPLTSADPKVPGLNPAERNAFRDLGSRLASRLKSADEVARGLIEKNDPREEPPVPVAAPQALAQRQPHVVPTLFMEDGDGLATQRPILDAMPIGILISRGSDFIYANPAFLTIAGRASLDAFAEAGGLNSMHVEFDGGADDDGGQRLRVEASDQKTTLEGCLVSVPVDGDNAMVLMLQPVATLKRHANTAIDADELSALLHIAADGIVSLDSDTRIASANRGAEELFGYAAGTLTGRTFNELFAPESERTAAALFNRLRNGDAAKQEACEIVGRRRQGGLVPLQLTLGRANSAGTGFHALFRDLTRWKETEKEMTAARHQAEKASAAKSEFLAKISHEMRTPLNAIIGFSEVMMEERFGPLGNERYRDYLKDINTSGAHIVSLLNDLLDLSKIEAGKMELSFERVDLNEITQQSVAIMQAQASRSRVIVRTALSMNVPDIVADARSIRQIALNLLSNSIKFTNAGGQVIVSTAASDRGEVILRVRDTGIGMSDKGIEAALQPFRQLTTSPRSDSHGTGLGLPLTKALVEANRARFTIKSAVNAGTLVEVIFPASRGRGE